MASLLGVECKNNATIIICLTQFGLKVLESLLTLINHDNVDLSIEVINLIKDLVDVEVTEDNSKYIVEFIKQLVFVFVRE